MKRLKTSRLAIALAIIGIPVLTGCGSNNGSSDITGTGQTIIGYTTQCTASGCVQVPIYGTAGGCIPISQPISFAGANVQVSSSGVMYAGLIPGSGVSAGTLTVTGSSPVSSTYTTMSQSDIGTELGMSITGASVGFGVNTGTATLTGTLQLSSDLQQQIAYYTEGAGMGIGTGVFGSTLGTTAGTLCVSQIAIAGEFYQTVAAFEGTVYLYLNNTQHGWSFPVY